MQYCLEFVVQTFQVVLGGLTTAPRSSLRPCEARNRTQVGDMLYMHPYIVLSPDLRMMMKKTTMMTIVMAMILFLGPHPAEFRNLLSLCSGATSGGVHGNSGSTGIQSGL